ncbi:mechanosensitive ion channel domain-containing protein [Botrimarina sp.]|uniref:mechanosensitive ion channel domain-containing protein n=1 Tax=Botrimarina sp. TaxID=2795802 RepID=UPI0032ED1C68
MTRRLALISWLLLVACTAAAADQSDESPAGGATKGPDRAAAPLTTRDLDVEVADLRVMVKPLTRSELLVEADAWFELLRAKARQIAVVRLGVRKSSEAAASTDNGAAEAALKEVEQLKKSVDESAADTEEQLTRSAKESLGVEQDAAVEGAEPAEEQTAEPSDQSPEPADAAAETKGQLLEDINRLQDERMALYDRLEVVLDSLEEKGGDAAEYRQYADAVSRVELETSDSEAAFSAILGWLASREGGRRWAWNLMKFAVTLAVAYTLAKFLGSVVNWLLERKINLSKLAERLIANTIKYVFLVVGFAVALTALEIDVTPILAAMGAAGLVVGLALQDSLSNVASGLMILINRPFDVGDIVSAGGVTGTVHQMNLVSTTFKTFDNQTIHVPNNEIWNSVVTNVTANDTRRVDLEFGIGYDDDFDRAEQIIEEVVNEHDLVLDDPSPVVVTHALADSSVNIVCRPWAKTSDWWQVKTDITREVKRRFDAEGITIPFPQRDIHVYHRSAPNGHAVGDGVDQQA